MNNRWTTKKPYFNVYKQNYLSMNFGLVKARARPPIKPRFINSALGWKGNAWKMTVVGTRKISNSDAPSFWLLPNRRSTEPTIRQAIAANNKKGANDSGIPCPEIASTTDENLVIFDGTATTKTADKQSLPMKSTDFHTCGWDIVLIGSLPIINEWCCTGPIGVDSLPKWHSWKQSWWINSYLQWTCASSRLGASTGLDHPTRLVIRAS